MLFKTRFYPGIARGDITVTFRVWTRAQVVAGRRYKLPPAGMIEVDSVTLVRLGEVTDAEACRAGFAARRELVDFMQRSARTTLDDDNEVYRVRFRFVGFDSPAVRAEIGTDEEAIAVRRKLDAMDRRSAPGPWTHATLTAIEARPGVSSAVLARELGWERQLFKQAVRKLKRLGLTESLQVGYRLSAYGRSYLQLQRAATGKSAGNGGT